MPHLPSYFTCYPEEIPIAEKQAHVSKVCFYCRQRPTTQKDPAAGPSPIGGYATCTHCRNHAQAHGLKDGSYFGLGSHAVYKRHPLLDRGLCKKCKQPHFHYRANRCGGGGDQMAELLDVTIARISLKPYCQACDPALKVRMCNRHTTTPAREGLKTCRKCEAMFKRYQEKLCIERKCKSCSWALADEYQYLQCQACLDKFNTHVKQIRKFAIESGICPYHIGTKTPLEHGKKSCQTCLKKLNHRIKQKKKFAIESGICPHHIGTKTPLEHGKKQCQACLEKQKNKNRQRQQQQKTTPPSPKGKKT